MVGVLQTKLMQSMERVCTNCTNYMLDSFLVLSELTGEQSSTRDTVFPDLLSHDIYNHIMTN